ncbi:MAG: menaquinone biosynthesis decarboxylase [Rikenellaceae bacterium]
MYKNLKSFIDRLELEGELVRVAVPVSSELEMCEIADRVSKSPDGGKAILFEQSGTAFPVIMNMMGSPRRAAMALGVEHLEDITERITKLLKDATSPKEDVWDKMRMLPLLAEMSQWLPSLSASSGECQQVVHMGLDARLAMLPILKCWPHDGGRFITLPMVNTIDPDSGQRNVGMYRMQVMGKHKTGMHWQLHKTGARHAEGYARKMELMPVAVALGGDPAYSYAATAPMPDNMDEYLLAGFLRRKSVKLVKCITSDIYVPSDCDIIIEGFVDPEEAKVTEGPFGDHTGFYSLEDRYPTFHITAITHRREAIYPATIVGVPPQEDAYIAEASERIFLAPIRFAIQPEVVDLYMPPAGTAHNLVLTSIDRRYAGQGQKVALGLWGTGQMMFNKYIVATEGSVDIRNVDKMAEQLRKVDLKRSVIRSEGILDVLDHATAQCGFGGKLAIDCAAENLRDRLAEPQIAEVEGAIADDRLIEKWRALLLFAEPGAEIEIPEMEGINYIAIFDMAAREKMSDYDLLWLAMANSDPRRDVELKGGTLILDARSKQPGAEGNPGRFPNVVCSAAETIALVDRRWEEYGIGDFIPSPSLKYQDLKLSEGARWEQS